MSPKLKLAPCLQGFVLFQVLLSLLLGARALAGADQAPQAPDEEHQDGGGHEQQQEPGLQSVRLRLSWVRSEHQF